MSDLEDEDGNGSIQEPAIITDPVHEELQERVPLLFVDVNLGGVEG